MRQLGPLWDLDIFIVSIFSMCFAIYHIFVYTGVKCQQLIGQSNLSKVASNLLSSPGPFHSTIFPTPSHAHSDRELERPSFIYQYIVPRAQRSIYVKNDLDPFSHFCSVFQARYRPADRNTTPRDHWSQWVQMNQYSSMTSLSKAVPIPVRRRSCWRRRTLTCWPQVQRAEHQTPCPPRSFRFCHQDPALTQNIITHDMHSGRMVTVLKRKAQRSLTNRLIYIYISLFHQIMIANIIYNKTNNACARRSYVLDTKRYEALLRGALWWMTAIYWPDFLTLLLSHVTPSIIGSPRAITFISCTGKL